MDKLPDYSSKRFLIVDDEPFMLSLIDRMLKQCGATHIVKASDGAAAMKSIKDNMSQVDVIISDCNMKPINGLQLLQAVRFGMNPHIPREQPFIMVTGQGDTDVVKSAIMLDVNGYLVKPVSPEKLMANLKRVFSTPTNIKEPEYYRAIKLATVHTLDAPLHGGEQGASKSSAWIVMSRVKPRANSAQIRAKIEAFKSQHATRDGETEVKIRNRRQCDLAELSEGMILAEDIHADEDHILLRRGTHLNAAMIDRLRELAVESDSRDHVWIGDLDKS